MSVRAKPTLIGLFVTGAIILAIVGVLMFGGGKFFNHKEKFIIYFSDSVNGLNVGSAVKFKGVQIGEVTNIFIRYDQDENSDAIPVLIEIDTTRLHRELGETHDLGDPQVFEGQVQGGLRARLQMQTLVTGQLFIELDYFETQGSKVKLEGLSHEYKEIPSVPSGLSEVIQSVTTALSNLGKVDFAEMAGKINHLTDELTKGVEQLNLKELNDSLISAANNLNAILADPKIKDALGKLGTTLDDLDHLAVSLNAQVQPLSSEIQTTTKSMQATLEALDQTLTAVRSVIAPDSPLHMELDKMINDISNAARAMRVLAEFLEANPTSVVTGKAPPSGPLSSPGSSTPPAAPAPAPKAATSSGAPLGGGPR